MIQKQIKNDDFTLEIKLEFGNSEPDVLYEKGVDMVTQALAGAIDSGELFPLFISELKKVVENMMSAIQIEQALKGEIDG